jgi:F-type H+-transporting ATPase subunit c
MITITHAANTATRKSPTEHLPSGACPSVRTAATTNQTKQTPPCIPLLAEITGNIASAFGLLGAAIGVGLIGTKAAEAVGRNPGASGKILVQAIIGMALAEGLGILALFLAK